jgi:hypothetical protein
MPTTTTEPVVTATDQHTFAINTRHFASETGEFTVTVTEMPGDNAVYRNHNRMCFARYQSPGRNSNSELSVHNVTDVETEYDEVLGNTTITVRTEQGETVVISLYNAR